PCTRKTLIRTGSGFSGQVIVSQGFNGTTRQESLFNLTFHVDTATPYSMAVFLLDGSVPSNSRLGLGLFVAGSITEFDFLDYPFTQFRTGQLAPGNYRLTSTVDGFDSPSNFGFSWYFSLPAPSTAPILGAGLLLAARRRRGNSHPLATFTY
ncbi:MAG TPA: hypothetical protein PKE29_12405, partial [Phycisphaerales bacterium]|nr:hypothetical protein [Phycisphaerales bacterium]